MNTKSDQDLLREYSEEGSEAAFAELVRRHVDFAYSVAFRIVRNSHLAEDVTQNVFVVLARNALKLSRRPVICGWLHDTARNLAANAIRSEVRRRAREQKAYSMNELTGCIIDASWEEVAPALDSALGDLGDSDKDAILLRYFQSKTTREIALELGISEEAAKKRVNRALDRLRRSLSKRNVTVGIAGLSLLITSNAVQSAPKGFAATIVAPAAAAQAAMGAAVIGTFGMTKALIAITCVAAAGAGFYQVHRSESAPLPVSVLKSDARAQVATNSSAKPDVTVDVGRPTMTVSKPAPARWTGRKQAHEPTLAEAEEDLTNALTQLGSDADRIPDVWVQRGELLARTGKWSGAVTNLRQALILDPHDAWAGYLLSSALLETRDLPAYQQHSHAMMIAFGGGVDRIHAGRTSEAYLVAPYGDNDDLQKSVSLVKSKPFRWWRKFYEGLAEYRLGDFAAAAALIEDDIANLPAVNNIDRSPCEADCYLVLAMARRQLNQAAAASKALEHGMKVVKTQITPDHAPDQGPYWWNSVTTRALLREARETVEQWTANPSHASFTFSLAQSAHQNKALIPLSGPYSEPPAGPLYIIPESLKEISGRMQFTIAGVSPGASVCVLASDELFTPTSWVPITTNVATSTNLAVTDIAATNDHKFFRIVETK